MNETGELRAHVSGAESKPSSGSVPTQDEYLEWPLFDSHIVFSQTTPGDGSCLIHAVAQALCIDYNSPSFNKTTEIRKLRDQLAGSLLKRNPCTGKILYETFADSMLVELAKTDPAHYSLDAILRQFYSSDYLGDEMISLISYMMNISIYVLDYYTKKVAMIWEQPSRPAIIILWRTNHYETVCLYDTKRDATITFFKAERDLIQLLRRHYFSTIKTP